MVGRLMRTVVPDILYLEYKSLYLELKPSVAAASAAPPGAAVAGRPPYHAARRDASPYPRADAKRHPLNADAFSFA